MENDIICFCRNIKKLRIRAGLSKKEMAKKLGIGLYSLNKLEKDILPPKLNCSVLFNIQEHFGIPPIDLFQAHK